MTASSTCRSPISLPWRQGAAHAVTDSLARLGLAGEERVARLRWRCRPRRLRGARRCRTWRLRSRAHDNGTVTTEAHLVRPAPCRGSRRDDALAAVNGTADSALVHSCLGGGVFGELRNRQLVACVI